MSRDWLGELFAFPTSSRVTTPSRGPGGTLWALQQVVKKPFSQQKSHCWERLLHVSRFGLANQCFLLLANTSHTEDALVVLPKDGPRPHQGNNVSVGNSTFYFYHELNLRPLESMCTGTTPWFSLWREDLCRGEDPVPKHLVLTASLQVSELRALLAASAPWRKFPCNFLLFLPIP